MAGLVLIREGRIRQKIWRVWYAHGRCWVSVCSRCSQDEHGERMLTKITQWSKGEGAQIREYMNNIYRSSKSSMNFVFNVFSFQRSLFSWGRRSSCKVPFTETETMTPLMRNNSCCGTHMSQEARLRVLLMLKDAIAKTSILETVPFLFSQNYSGRLIAMQRVFFRIRTFVSAILAICALIVAMLTAIIILASTTFQK